MFGNQSLSITFGPVGDILFLSFLILGNGVFAGIIINYIVIEWRSWFDKDEETEEKPATVNVYNNYPAAEPIAHYTVQEDGQVMDNIKGEYIDPDEVPQTGFAPVLKFPESGKTEEELFEAASEAMKKFSTGPLVLMDDAAPKVEFKPFYFVQWSTDPEFKLSSVDRTMRTNDPGHTALEMLAEYGSGHIRWRLAGDDNETPEWNYKGFYSAANNMVDQES